MENQEKKIVSIAFEGIHRTGKGTHIENLKNRLGELGIPYADIRGEGSRPGKGGTTGDPPSEPWLKLNEALHKREGGEDVDRWDEAAYRLARELIVWRDRFLKRKIEASDSPFGALIVDRSLLSRAALMKHRLQPPPDKIFSTEDLYPEKIQNRKKITVEMILPDIIIELVAPKEVLISRLEQDDPRYEFRKRNIETMYVTYMEAKNHLSEEIRKRIVTIDSSRNEDEIFTDIEVAIRAKFPELIALNKTDENQKETKDTEEEDIEGRKKIIEDFLNKSSITDVESIEPVSGGLVHHVFCVHTKDREYYVKLRGDRFAGMPTVESNPQDIRNEAKALRIASDLFPDTFPHVVAKDDSKGLLVISSIMNPEENLLRRLREKTLTADDIVVIGSTLRKIHSSLATVTEPIREDGDEQYYKNNLLYRLGSQNNSALEEVINDLSKEPRQLILGDLSPKNLGLVDGQLKICDLDTVHRGNAKFDVGFFVSHIYTHALESNYPAASLTKRFLESHETDDVEEVQLKRIVLGIMLYRLNNAIVPYPLNITDEEKQRMVVEINSLLTKDNLEWEEIEKKLRYAKSH